MMAGKTKVQDDILRSEGVMFVQVFRVSKKIMISKNAPVKD